MFAVRMYASCHFNDKQHTVSWITRRNCQQQERSEDTAGNPETYTLEETRLIAQMGWFTVPHL